VARAAADESELGREQRAALSRFNVAVGARVVLYLLGITALVVVGVIGFSPLTPGGDVIAVQDGGWVFWTTLVIAAFSVVFGTLLCSLLPRYQMMRGTLFFIFFFVTGGATVWYLIVMPIVRLVGLACDDPAEPCPFDASDGSRVGYIIALVADVFLAAVEIGSVCVAALCVTRRRAPVTASEAAASAYAPLGEEAAGGGTETAPPGARTAPSAARARSPARVPIAFQSATSHFFGGGGRAQLV
jgi:hypothetical protein